MSNLYAPVEFTTLFNILSQNPAIKAVAVFGPLNHYIGTSSCQHLEATEEACKSRDCWLRKATSKTETRHSLLLTACSLLHPCELRNMRNQLMPSSTLLLLISPRLPPASCLSSEQAVEIWDQAWFLEKRQVREEIVESPSLKLCKNHRYTILCHVL